MIRLLLPLALLAVLPAAAAAQGTLAFWNNSTGLWSEPARWSTNPAFPNGPDFGAVINGGNVTLDGDYAVQFFGLGGGTLISNSNRTLINNAGFTFLTGSLGNGNAANTVTVISNGGVSLRSGAENGTPGTAGNATINAASWINSSGSTVTQSNTDNPLNFGNGALVTNAGTWLARTDNGFRSIGGSSTFQNNGLFRRELGTGNFVVGINGPVAFNNAGTVDLQTGALLLGSGGAASGLFSIGSGARLELNSDYTFNAGGAVSGAGTLLLQNGQRSVTASLSFPVAQVRQTGGLLLVAQGQTLTIGGALEFLGGGIGNGQAAQSGTVRAAGGLTIGGGGLSINNSTLLVPGGVTAVQNNPSDFLRLGSNGVLQIDGTYRAQTNNGIVNNGGGGVGLVNNGTFIRDTATGTFNASINGPIPFTNAGSVQVQTGTLVLPGGGSSTGNFDVSSGATLAFDTYTFGAGTTATGAGLLVWNIGVQSFPESLTLTIARPRQVNSTFFIGQGRTLTLTGAFEWMGGTIGNGQAAQSGTLRVEGGVTIGPGGGQTINHATLHIPPGAAAIQANTSDFVRLATNGQIRNDGTYFARTDNGIVNNGGGGVGLVNQGLFVRDTGSGYFNTSINGLIPFTNAGSVQVQTGTLGLNGGGSSTGSFSISGGAVLEFNSSYAFQAGTSASGAGRLLWSGGNQSFPSSLTLAVAQPRLTTAALHIAQGQTLTLSGAFEWMGGTIGSGQPAQSGTLRINGGATVGPGGGQTINNATLHIPPGASLFQANTTDFVRLGSSGRILNDGTYYAQTNNGIVNNGGGGVSFVNNGTFVRDTGAGVFNGSINGSIPFTNAGTVQVQTGTLRLSGGGASTGAFEVAASALLDFDAGYVFDTGTTAIGAGRLSLSGGAHGIPTSRTFEVGFFRLGNAALLVAQGQTLTLNGHFEWTGGTIGNGLVANSGTVRASGGATIGPDGGQTINNATVLIPAGAVVSQVNTTDFLRLANGALLRIDGTYYARTDNGIVNSGGALGIVNNGSFIRDTASGTFNSSIGGSIPFTNAGSVQVQTGRLQLGGGGSASGSFAISEGATLELAGNFTLSATASVTGTGLLRLPGGNLIVPASLALAVAQVEQAGGNINIAPGQTLALAGAHAWSGGTIFGGGTVLAAAGGTFTNGQNLAGATYAIAAGATVTIPAGNGFTTLSSGAKLANAGLLLARSDSGVSSGGGGAVLENTGVLHRDAGSGVFALFNGAALDNTGTVMVSSGTLRLDSIVQFSGGTLGGGTWQVNANGTLTGGGFGSGIVTNAAVIRLVGAGSAFPALAPLASNTGTLRLDARNFTTAGNFSNAGRLELLNGSAFQVPNGSTLTNASIGVLTGQGSVHGQLVNFGTIEARGASTTLVLTGNVTNNGLFVAAAGGTINAVNTTFVNNGVLDNTTGTILLPADFTNNGVLLGPSLVRIRSAVKTGNTITLAVDGLTGHSYQLQRSLDLASDTFVNLGAPQVGSSGNQLIFTDENASGAKGFYRVVVD